MPVMDTGPIDNRNAPRTASLSIRLFNSGRLPAIAGVEVYHVNPAGDGFTNETIYQIRLVSLNPFGQPGSGFTVDNVFANLDVFGVRVITSGQGGNDIGAVISEFTANGQIIKEHVLTGEMAQSPELLFAYVSDIDISTIRVIETGTQSVVTAIGLPFQSSPRGLAVTPDGSRIYVAMSGTPDGVAVISTATNTTVANILFPDGSTPLDVAITPDGSRVYVVNISTETLTIINTADNEILATIPLDDGSNPSSIAITPDGSRVYVTNQGDDGVTVISTATNTILTTIDLTNGSNPNDIAITPDGSWAYVVATGNDTVIVIDTATNMVVATLSIPAGNFPSSIAITPDGAKAYVTNVGFTDSVTVINILTKEIMLNIPSPAGSNPYSIAITPDGTRAYVGHLGPGQITVIDTFSDSVVASLPSEIGPMGIAITPILLF